MGTINENNILYIFTMPGVDKDSDIILWRDDEGDGEDTNGYIIITEAIPTGRKDEDGKNPSTFINDTLNELYDKAVKLRDDFIDGEDYTEHSMITITVNTEKLEDRGLLDEQ